MIPSPKKVLEISEPQVEELLRRLDRNELEPDDFATLRAALESYRNVARLLEYKSTTIARLRKLLFGASTEKTADVLGRNTTSPAPGKSVRGVSYWFQPNQPRFVTYSEKSRISRRDVFDTLSDAERSYSPIFRADRTSRRVASGREDG